MNTLARSLIALGSAATLGLAIPSVSSATTSTGNIAVSATVAKNCNITAGSVAFSGAYDPVVANATAALTQTGSFTIACTKNVTASVTLGAGNNGSHGITGYSRAMTDGSSDYLPYELYQDAAFHTAWTGTAAVSITPGLAGQSQSVYAQIPAAQNVPSGSYSDTVIATASF